MKIKETIPVVSSIIVVIKDIKYEDSLCTIEVTCNTMNNEGTKWSPTTAKCEEPYFIMGSGFWKDNFGTRQANRIKKLCDQAIKDYLAKEQTCKTCDGVKVVHSSESTMYNCELGGDCSNDPKWTEERCKTCGKTVPCPECMPVANEYYLLWMRDNRNMNLAHRKIEKLKKK